MTTNLIIGNYQIRISQTEARCHQMAGAYKL